MDSITHALLVVTLLMVIGVPALVPFGILGAVILDADILFYLFSSKRPSLYMFIHGGAAHSIAGAAGMAVIASASMFIIVLAAGYFFQFIAPFTFNLQALGAVITGAILHVLLDFFASPGIPLLWPGNDTRYTLGIFAGPSAVMICISLVFILLILTGFILFSGLIFYGVLFLAYLAISVFIRLAAAFRINGGTIPTINPLRWMVIEKSQDCWSLKFVDLLNGNENGNRTWVALRGVTKDTIARVSDIPEVRRVNYHSYFTIASRQDNGNIVIQDPARVEGIVRYPPYYTSVTLKGTERDEGWEVI